MKKVYENVSLGFIGDIHGDFQKLQKLIKPFENTVFIVVGDCGFGFSNTKEDKIRKMLKSNFNDFLEKRNLYLLFIRGNHDDPGYFTKDKVNFTDRFVLVPDYTFLSINEITILCIGGAVSVDRRFRKVSTDYWYGEEMGYFDNYLVKNIGVNIIAAHTVNKQLLSHYLPPIPDWLRISFDVDKKLKPDTEFENKVCMDILKYYKPQMWIHGHYHVSGRSQYNNTEIISLNCNELYEYRSR